MIVAKSGVKSLNAPEYDALLEVLRAAREAAGLSPYAVAQRLGEDPAYVYKVEARERRLDVVEFARLSRALGIEPRELFGRWLDRAGA